MPAPSIIRIQDSSGQAWQVGVTNDGILTTTAVAGTAPLFLLINDITITQTWQMGVEAGTGRLQLTATTNQTAPTQFVTAAPNGTLFAIQASNTFLQTLLDNSCADVLSGVNYNLTARFKWITLVKARAALAGRLADPNMTFWTSAELNLYLTEALRTWNALTEIWNVDVAFTPCSMVWYDFGTLIGSPRMRTVTDAYLYTVMQYHLLEQSTGALPWGGTSQFTLADLQFALQRAQDEMIQMVDCNLANISVSSSVNSRRTMFQDNVLDAIRARFVPAVGLANTMTREDTLAFNSFEPDAMQTPSTPQAWSLITDPPLGMDVDTAPNVPGSYDVIALQSGPTFAPPNQTVLGVPDDWSWVAKWGALADLLGRESEATDRQRADYCLKRYQTGLQIMRQSNWIVQGQINGVPCDTPSLREMDGFAPEWQDDPNAWPGVVTAGIDFAAPCPVASPSVLMTVVANAPVPVNDTDYVQVSRDAFDVILDYAQVLAAFKMGGEDFASTKDLEQNFFKYAAQTNKRLLKTGLFVDTIRSEGKRQNEYQPR